MRKHFSQTTGLRRIAYGALVGVAVLVTPSALSPEVRGLLAWCAGATVYLVLAWWLALASDARQVRKRAQAQDQSAIVIFLVMMAAVLASLGAIAAMLLRASGRDGSERVAEIALSLLALACSWLMIQSLYAFRYAHRYYQEEARKSPTGGGLQFPGEQDPDYFDFMYYSHVVGMTSQVSDVQVTSRHMRRLTLVHSMLSFAFNMLVLALSVNVVAGLM
ncbi:MAG: DUF1345 domain-containing protein [Burkholderiaceae bacterium]|nr:DUF1345 domain-containing protein [Burkholderiaceae bacterium]